MSFFRSVLAGAVLAALSSSPVLAQTAISAGQTVQGALTGDSPKADDGTPYALYTYRGTPGERIRVRMESEAFDAFLMIGSTAAPGCSDDCRMDDDSGGSLNASLAYTIPASGQVQIRANSISATDTGAFTLSVTRLPPQAAPTVRPLRIGQSVSGRFGDSSSTDDNDIPYDLWSLQGRPGQVLVVRMNSDELDTYLESGRMEGRNFISEAQDDDSGGSLNARMRVTLDRNGRALIKARSYSASTGSYTISANDPPTPRPVTVANIAVGESVRARLDSNDPFDGDDEIRYDVYRITGNPGQRVVVRMESADFDSLLRWGVYDGERFVQDLIDDDSGGGLSAQFTVTLDADGSGRLHATSYSAAEGAYTLSVVAAPRATK